MSQITKDEIIIDDWYGGLSPKFWQTNANARKSKEGAINQYQLGVVNPMFYPGLLVPGSGTYTNLTNIDQLSSNDVRVIKFVLVDDNNVGGTGTSLYFGSENLIEAADISSDTIISASEFPYTINATAAGSVADHSSHTNERVNDLVLYQLNGAQRLWYFYVDSADGDGSTYDLLSSFTADTGGTDSDDAFSRAVNGLVLDNGVAGGSTTDERAIVAEVADNNLMYVMNINNVHQFDGTTAGGSTGTITQNVLQFDVSKKIIDAKDGLGNMWIAVSQFRTSAAVSLANSERFCMVYVWNRRSDFEVAENVVIIKGVSDVYNIFFHRSVPHIFTRSTRGIIELRRLIGGRFEVIKEVGDSGYQPANRHSVITFGLGILWTADNGKIMYFGRAFDGQRSESLYQMGESPADATSSDTGALVRVSDSEVYLSFNDGTTERVSVWDPFATTAQADATEFLSMIYDLPKLSEVTGVTVFYPPQSAGASANDLRVALYKNFDNQRIGGDFYDIDGADDGARGWKYFPLSGLNFKNINTIQIGLTFAGGNTIDQSITPYRVIIHYRRTSKLT